MQNDVMKSDLEQPEEVLHLSTWHWFLGLSKQKEVSTLEIFGNDHYIIHLHFIYLLYDYLWIHIKKKSNSNNSSASWHLSPFFLVTWPTAYLRRFHIINPCYHLVFLQTEHLFIILNLSCKERKTPECSVIIVIFSRDFYNKSMTEVPILHCTFVCLL